MSESLFKQFARWSAAMAIAISTASAVGAGATGKARSVIPHEEGQAAAKREAPARTMPTSQHELWQRLLELLAENGGFTPVDRAEAVLGIRFTQSDEETVPPTLGLKKRHMLETRIDGLGNLVVALFDDPKKTRLGIRWGTGHCLSFRQATEDLHRLGWKSEKRAVRPGSGGQLDFYLPEEAAFATAHRLNTNTFSGHQGLSMLYLSSSVNQYSDCLNHFNSNVWRTPLHKTPSPTTDKE